MADQKTKPTEVTPEEFLAGIEPARKREEAEVLLDLYRRVTGVPAVMWGPAIIGFGSYTYRYASGTTGESCAAGFSPRKQQHTLYFTDGFDLFSDALERLGPNTTSTGSCLYLKKLDGIDLDLLAEMIRDSFELRNGTHFTP